MNRVVGVIHNAPTAHLRHQLEQDPFLVALVFDLGHVMGKLLSPGLKLALAEQPGNLAPVDPGNFLCKLRRYGVIPI